MLGQAFVSVMIVISLVVVPYETNQLASILSSASKYARISFTPDPEQRHVILIGAVNHNSLEHFLHEFYSSTSTNMRVVVLGTTPPSPDIEKIISDPAVFEGMVTYIEGSVLNPKDLERCAALSSEAVFFVGKKFAASPTDEDNLTILRYLSLKRCESCRARTLKRYKDAYSNS